MADGSKFSLTVIYPEYRMSTISIALTRISLPDCHAFYTENGLAAREYRGTWVEILSVLSRLQSAGLISTWGQCSTALLMVQSGDLVLQEDSTGNLSLTPLRRAVSSIASHMRVG